MGKKICPICDGPLGIGDFCATCKRRIKNPVIISSDMHLNEHHSKREVDCEFHGEPVSPFTGNTNRPEVNAAPVKAPQTDNSSDTPTGRTLKKVRMKLAIVGIMVYIVLTANKFFRNFEGLRLVSGSVESAQEEIAPEEIAPEEETSLEIRTVKLTLEEAQAIGGRCDAFNHLPILKDTLVDFLKVWYPANNYALNYEENSMVNEIDYQGEEERKWFMDTYYFSLDKDTKNEGTYYLELSSDTVTGEFHSLTAYLKTEEESRQLMLDFGTFIESGIGVSAKESDLADSISKLEFTGDGAQMITDYGYYFAGESYDGFYIYIDSYEQPKEADE